MKARRLTGETDLARLLAGLDPELDAVEYCFETVADAPPLGDAFALIREAEGVTRIGPGAAGRGSRCASIRASKRSA